MSALRIYMVSAFKKAYETVHEKTASDAFSSPPDRLRLQHLAEMRSSNIRCIFVAEGMATKEISKGSRDPKRQLFDNRVC
jgi:hypothetical protein